MKFFLLSFIRRYSAVVILAGLISATFVHAQSVQWFPVESYPATGVESILFTSSGTLLVNSGGGGFSSRIYRSTDVGSTWTQHGQRPMVGTLIECSNGDILLIRDNTYDRSTDDGITWEGVSTYGVSGSLDVFGAAVSPTGDVFIWSFGQGVYRSSDDGFSWEKLDGIGSERILSVAFGESVIYVGGDSGVYRSTDDGLSWQHSRSGLDTQWVRSLTVAQNGHVFAGTGDRFVYRSTDQGETWTWAGGWEHEGSSHQVNKVQVLHDGSVVAASISEGLFRSTDYGLTWQRWDNGIDSPYNITTLAFNRDGVLFTEAGLSDMKLYSTQRTSGIGERHASRDLEEPVAVLPNPAGDNFTVYVPEGETIVRVSLFDGLGRLIIHRDAYRESSRSMTIDLTGMNRGIYSCRVEMRGRVTTRQIVVR